MTKHTPAPWKYVEADNRQPWPSYAILDAEGYTIVPPMTNKSNVKLICAAPELLEALEDIIWACKNMEEKQIKRGEALDFNLIKWRSFIRPAQEAVNKARGE